MIRKIEMYQAVCDGCGRKGACYPSRKACMHMVPLVHRWHEIDGKLYCPDCVEWNPAAYKFEPKKKEQ